MNEGIGSENSLPNNTQLGSGSTRLKPVVYRSKVLFGWLSLEFHSTNRCWRKVKIRFIHQPEADGFLLLSRVPLSSSLLGALQLPIQISYSFFSPGFCEHLKKSTLGWFTAPCADLLTVFVP